MVKKTSFDKETKKALDKALETAEVIFIGNKGRTEDEGMINFICAEGIDLADEKVFYYLVNFIKGYADMGHIPSLVLIETLAEYFAATENIDDDLDEFFDDVNDENTNTEATDEDIKVAKEKADKNLKNKRLI